MKLKPIHYFKILLLVVTITVAWVLLLEGFSKGDLSLYFTDRHNELSSFIQAHYLKSIAIYLLLMIAFTTISLPIIIYLSFFSGYLFGFAEGFTFTYTGCVIGAVIAYWFNYFLYSDINLKKSSGKLKSYIQFFQKNQFIYLFIVRFFGIIPFVYTNFICGAVKANFKYYLITLFVGIVPSTVIVTSMGNAFAFVAENQSNASISEVVSHHCVYLPVVGFFVICIASIIAHKRFLKPKPGTRD